MAIILLKGTYNKNAAQLSSWRTYACISLGIYILIALGHSLLPYSSVGMNALRIIGGVVVQGFCIWVVGVHREEIMKYGVCGP
ncbi:unnamed protein product [Allacma fusca]|uniref:Uncharacterized protein n=1 Tax=Allacma fusca TaxID=39272 RepID=A0A8J2KFC2_9HEXA|nr:unnamed protein product [Allacma fusca]